MIYQEHSAKTFLWVSIMSLHWRLIHNTERHFPLGQSQEFVGVPAPCTDTGIGGIVSPRRESCFPSIFIFFFFLMTVRRLHPSEVDKMASSIASGVGFPLWNVNIIIKLSNPGGVAYASMASAGSAPRRSPIPGSQAPPVGEAKPLWAV